MTTVAVTSTRRSAPVGWASGVVTIAGVDSVVTLSKLELGMDPMAVRLGVECEGVRRGVMWWAGVRDSPECGHHDRERAGRENGKPTGRRAQRHSQLRPDKSLVVLSRPCPVPLNDRPIILYCRRDEWRFGRRPQLRMASTKTSPVIVITGTPGTGKSTHAELLVQESPVPLRHINVSEFVKEKELYENFDAEWDSHIVDEDKARARGV